MRLPYTLRRFLYALRYAVIGFRTGWRAHKAIHEIAEQHKRGPAGYGPEMAEVA
jgi:hypothetical protein